MNQRQLQVKRGQETEERVVKLLNKYGIARREKGSHGEPDAVFISKNYKFGIEIKRLEGCYFKKSINSISVSKDEWKNLLIWCRRNQALPLLIVEIVVNGSESIYQAIPLDVVDYKFVNGEGTKFFNFTMWQVLSAGVELNILFDILVRGD